MNRTHAPHNAQVSTKPASEKQIAFLESLRASRTPSVDAEAVKAWAEQAGSAAVSKRIDWLKAQPVVAGPISSKSQWQGQQAAPKEEPSDGIYYVEATNEIYKVYKMVHGSGRQGVKRLEHNMDDHTGSFTYMGLAVKHLPADAVLMPLEKAKEFGKIYGFCVRCGRTLTDDESIAAGIGPICSGKWA